MINKYIISKNNFAKQVAIWQKKYQIYTPSPQGKDFVWQELVDSKKAIISAVTILPPKKFYFPSKEILFKFINNKTVPEEEIKPIILLGINNIDLLALQIFDKALKSDHYYNKHKKNIILIGYGPKLTNSHYDLYIIPDSQSYQIKIGSQIGKSLLCSSLVKPLRQSDLELIKPLNYSDPLFLDTNRLSTAIIKSVNDKLWDKLADICFGCGNCAYVCPLCYCFSVDDEIELDNQKCPSSCQLCSGKRVRSWDACFLPNFSLIAGGPARHASQGDAGGHNFREKLRDRIYNWYHHKFVRFPKEFGTVGCVNCGRCIKYCPTKINYRKVLEEVLVKYQ